MSEKKRTKKGKGRGIEGRGGKGRKEKQEYGIDGNGGEERKGYVQKT